MNDIYIPPQFQDGRPIEQVILVCDVDGVIRENIEAEADSRIIQAIRTLTTHYYVDVAFISGSPVVQDPGLEIWRRGGHTLDRAVGYLFLPELNERKVTIYGSLGGQRMTDEGIVFLEQYPLEVIFELARLLLDAFLNEVERQGSYALKMLAKTLHEQIGTLTLLNTRQLPSQTPEEFHEIILKIRSEIDARFRLISYGTFVETHTSNPPWHINHSIQWLKERLESSNLLISQFSQEQKQISGGLALSEGEEFNFLMISKTNKGITIKKHIEERLQRMPQALIVTIGDTQVDFPMHHHAHLAFHVGQEWVWRDHPIPHCKLVKDKHGCDRQHVEGTLWVLNLLRKGMGKPLYKWTI